MDSETSSETHTSSTVTTIPKTETEKLKYFNVSLLRYKTPKGNSPHLALHVAPEYESVGKYYDVNMSEIPFTGLWKRGYQNNYDIDTVKTTGEKHFLGCTTQPQKLEEIIKDEPLPDPKKKQTCKDWVVGIIQYATDKEILTDLAEDRLDSVLHPWWDYVEYIFLYSHEVFQTDV